MYISTPQDLAEFCERAAAFDAVAVDTEFLRERTYRPRLCLIQVATPKECVAIDPLAIDDLGALAQLMRNRRVMKVFHACGQDLEVLFHALGTLPKPIFDTQVAAAFLGQRVQSSYNELVRTYCGVNLPKADSLTDWSRRPLAPSQLEYALDDVRYLIQAYARVSRELEDKGRLRWVASELAPLTDPDHYVVDRFAMYKRVKRVASLTRHQLALARELAAWREARAEKTNVPRKWVMADETLLAVCKRAPQSVADLRCVRGTEQLTDRDAEMAVAAVRRGLACPAEKLPPAGKRRTAPDTELECVSDLMYALLRLISERSGVATTMIASREDLIGYVTDPQGSRLSQGWRHELVGATLDDLLEGRVGLTVKDSAVERL